MGLARLAGWVLWSGIGLAVAAWLAWFVASGQLVRRLAFWRWLWRAGFFWFQRTRPGWEHPTRIYEGEPGSGKTLCMVRDCVRQLRKGVRVCSNVAIRDPLTGRRSEECTTWLQFIEWALVALRDGRPTLFAFDEMHLILDARDWQRTPLFVRWLVSQHRHFNIGIIGTTQDVSQVEKRVRVLARHLVRLRRMSWLRFMPWFLKRLPLYWSRLIDPRTVDGATGTQEVGGRTPVWMPYYAYHGYSTLEIVSSEDSAVYKDEEIQERIAAMCEEAEKLRKVLGLPAFVDGAPVAVVD